MSYPERIIPDETERGVVALHLKRYEFALTWCEGKDVLDAACGVGYGSAHLATRARRVVGIDRSADAIAYGRTRYAADNVELVAGDVAELPFEDGSFDVVCSFETIEHLTAPEAFLAETARVLRTDGVLIASTPSVERTNLRPDNPFHEIELSRADFTKLLERRFIDVDLYGQRRVQTARHRLLQRADVFGLRRHVPALRRAARLTGTPATEDATLDDIEISRDALADANEIVAVCRRPLP